MATIVGLGEVLWDVFADHKRPGGAPCNVAYQAAQLGHRGIVATRVGADALGEELVTFLHGRGVDTSCIQTDQEHPTGTVEVTITDGEPSYVITENVAWDYLVLDDRLRHIAATADAICYVSLAQRAPTTRATIQAMLTMAHPDALRVFDVNLRPPFIDVNVLIDSFAHANVVKMGEGEAEDVARLLGRSDLTNWLLNEQGAEVVCITRGKDGAELITKEAQALRKGERVDTSGGDAVGVGDAFLAATTHGLLRRWPLADVLDFANRYAALIVTKRGGMPMLSKAELAAFL